MHLEHFNFFWDYLEKYAILTRPQILNMFMNLRNKSNQIVNDENRN